jgi:predicted amidophosphoribosyltransferase
MSSRVPLGQYALCPTCQRWMKDQPYCYCRGCGKSYAQAAVWPGYSTPLEKSPIPMSEMDVFVDLPHLKYLEIPENSEFDR